MYHFESKKEGYIYTYIYRERERIIRSCYVRNNWNNWNFFCLFSCSKDRILSPSSCQKQTLYSLYYHIIYIKYKKKAVCCNWNLRSQLFQKGKCLNCIYNIENIYIENSFSRKASVLLQKARIKICDCSQVLEHLMIL